MNPTWTYTERELADREKAVAKAVANAPVPSDEQMRRVAALLDSNGFLTKRLIERSKHKGSAA